MRRGGIGGALLILVLVTCSWGYTVLDLGMGSEVFRGSARCGGMGEVSLLCERSPLAVALNPAALAGLEGPMVAGSYRLLALDEDWLLPVHDSFDAILGYETYSRNTDVYNNGDVGLASGVIQDALGLSLALAYVPVYDFNYNFSLEVRDRSTQSEPADEIIANAFVEGDGGIRSLTFGAARSLGEAFALGVSIDYLFGDYDLSARLSDIAAAKLPCWDKAPAETSESFSASKLSGVRYRCGADLTVSERVELAFAFTSRSELEGDYRTNSEDGLLGFLRAKKVGSGGFSMEYPASYVLGVTFRPRNKLLTVVEADVRYIEWSHAGNQALRDLNLNDTYEWFIGVEHVFYNGRPLRFGFSYKPSAVDKEIAESAVTVGSGMDIYGFQVDAGVKVGWRGYRRFALFNDALFCATPRDFSDQVKETAVGGVISVSRRF